LHLAPAMASFGNSVLGLALCIFVHWNQDAGPGRRHRHPLRNAGLAISLVVSVHKTTTPGFAGPGEVIHTLGLGSHSGFVRELGLGFDLVHFCAS
jgi:hypothetical protein